MIKTTVPDKSGNPASLKKLSQHFDSFSTKGVLQFLLLFFLIYSFVIQMISEKTVCSKGFTSYLIDIFILKLS